MAHPLMDQIRSELAISNVDYKSIRSAFTIAKSRGRMSYPGSSMDPVLEEALFSLFNAQHKRFTSVIEKLLRLFEEGGKAGSSDGAEDPSMPFESSPLEK